MRSGALDTIMGFKNLHGYRQLFLQKFDEPQNGMRMYLLTLVVFKFRVRVFRHPKSIEKIEYKKGGGDWVPWWDF